MSPAQFQAKVNAFVEQSTAGIETMRPIIEDMVATFDDELREAGIDGRTIRDRAGNHLPQLQRIGRIVFDRWAKLIEPSHQLKAFTGDET